MVVHPKMSNATLQIHILHIQFRPLKKYRFVGKWGEGRTVAPTRSPPNCIHPKDQGVIFSSQVLPSIYVGMI